jgi:hypothetical protein
MWEDKKSAAAHYVDLLEIRKHVVAESFEGNTYVGEFEPEKGREYRLRVLDDIIAITKAEKDAPDKKEEAEHFK